MRLTFKGQKMLLANVNARSERQGAELEPACDLKLEADLSNEILSEFHPALKSLLYFYDESIEHDLADKGTAAPDLRLPNLVTPLKWEEQILGASISIMAPGKATIQLSPVKVNNFSIEPRQGGTISLSFRVQAHPDEAAMGKLGCLVQHEVEVTLAEAEEVKPAQ